MQPDVFDQVVEEERDVFDQVLEDGTEKKKGGLSKAAKEIPVFGARGVAKGAATPGGILDLLGLQAGEQLPGERIRAERQAQESAERPSFASMLGDDDILPPSSRIASPQDVQEFSEFIGLPERAETAIGRGAERVGGVVPFLPFGGAQSLIGGAIGGQVVEEAARALGAESPEFIGDIGELATGVGLGVGGAALERRVPAAGKAKEFVENARKLNLTEQEIGILTRKPRTTKALLKFGKKTDKTQQLANSLNQTLGSSYDVIKQKASKLPPSGFVSRARMTSRLERILKDLESGGKVLPGPRKEAIDFIKLRLDEIGSGKVDITPRYLIETFQQANESINWRSMKGGGKKLAAIKEPILQELRKASPELARDFETTNKLYSNFSQINNSFSPGALDNLIDAGKAIGAGGTILTGIVTMNPGLIGTTVLTLAGETASRRFLTKMATDPALMNMGKKAATAINNNKPEIALNIARKMVGRMADEIEGVDEEQLLEALFAGEPTSPPSTESESE